MKIKLLILVLISTFLFSACQKTNISAPISEIPSGSLATWDRKGLSFKYPLDMTASESETGDIIIKKSNISKLLDSCREQFETRGELLEDTSFASNSIKEMQDALFEIKTNGLTYDNSEIIKSLEFDTCRFAGENISVKPLTSDDNKGVIFIKGIGQDSQSYYIQVLIINKKDDVYILTFNPVFNTTMKDIIKIAGNDSLNETYKNALIRNIPFDELPSLKSNLESIDKIISSIKIDNSY